MFEKSRSTHGRSRTTPRDDRRDPNRWFRGRAALLAARAVAVGFVSARWPALAGVEPEITAQRSHSPSSDLLARLGMNEADVVLRSDAGGEYTFTFAGQRDTADGVRAPLVAAVTVDATQRVVKTSVSK